MLLLVLIAFFASIVGAMSGIGGGLIFKPLINIFTDMSIREVNFLSGMTVLCMALYSCLIKLQNLSIINFRVIIFLICGSVLGGFVGNYFLHNSTNHLDYIQAVLLVLINSCVLIYALHKHKLHTFEYKNPFIIVVFGLILGTISSFLGIGGGPINIAVLHYYFSFNMKIASINSLFIILLTQISSLGASILTNNVPDVDPYLLLYMGLGGISGAMVGQKIISRFTEHQANRLFIILNIALVLLSLYNLIRLFF